jgi:predicted dehydrogenase
MMDFGCYGLDAISYFAGDITKILSATPTLLEEGSQIDTAMEVNLLCGETTGYLKVDFKATQILPNLLSVNIIGENENITCDNLIAPHFFHTLKINKRDKNAYREEKVYEEGYSTYYYQLKSFIEEINGGEKCETNISTSLKNMYWIDKIYSKAKLKIRPTNPL